MADETEETLDDRLERLQRRAENFRDLLKDGDEVTVALLDGEVHIAESYRSVFERKHPKLFGRMLSIDAQMHAGWLPYVAALIVVGVFIFGLQLKWWDAGLGETVSVELNSWWFYIAAPALALYVAYFVCGQWGKLVYRRSRAELHDLIAKEQLDRDVLLVMLRDEDELDRVVHALKLDTGTIR